MSAVDWLLLFAALAGISAAGLAVLLYRHRERRLLERLSRMLDAAMDGSFTESRFDESLLSAVEAKLVRYLTASQVSARNLGAERDKIKALISDISHQTKTPVSNILLYAQLLAEQPLPDQSLGCVAALNGQAEKLSFLISALVELSRLESGILSLSPKPGPLAPMLRSAAEQIMPAAAAKELSLNADFGELRAVFDPKWTGEAIYNLLDNAVKYTPTGGTVTLRVMAYEFFCRVDISDTGIGVAEDEQAKVFSRFYRSPSVSDAQGVGIGLYLARQIISGQGGYIKLSSAPGKGSTFSVFLPACG